MRKGGRKVKGGGNEDGRKGRSSRGGRVKECKREERRRETGG